MSQAWADHLDLLIRARTPILWIRSQEEERIANLLAEAAKRLDQRSLARWDYISGLRGWAGRDGEAARNPLAALESLSALPAERPALLVLHDFHRYADDSSICRKLRNLASSLR